MEICDGNHVIIWRKNHFKSNRRKPIPRYTTRVGALHVCTFSFESVHYLWRSATEKNKKMKKISIIFRFLTKSYGGIFRRPTKPIPRCTTRVGALHVYTFSFESVQQLWRSVTETNWKIWWKKCQFLTKSHGSIFRWPTKPIPRCTTRVPPLHACRISFQSVQYFWRSATETKTYAWVKKYQFLSRRNFSTADKTYTQVHN